MGTEGLYFVGGIWPAAWQVWSPGVVEAGPFGWESWDIVVGRERSAEPHAGQPGQASSLWKRG